MKMFFLVSAFCGLAAAQTAPDNNAAAANLRKRLLTLNLNAPAPLRLVPLTPRVNKGVCSIPLLNVMPAGNYKMRVMPPPSPPAEIQRGGTIQVPAPECDAAFFASRDAHSGR